MAKISLALVFALVLAVPFHSVLGQDSWMSIIDEAGKAAGISGGTLDEAEKAIGDGSAEKAAEEAMGDSSIDDWIQQAQAHGMTGAAGSLSPNTLTPAEAPENEVADSSAEAPQGSFEGKSPANGPPAESPQVGDSPSYAPTDAPTCAPTCAPTDAPTESPADAPEAQAPHAEAPQA